MVKSDKMQLNVVCKTVLVKVTIRIKEDTYLPSRPREGWEKKLRPHWRRLWGQQCTQGRAGGPIGKEVERMLKE